MKDPKALAKMSVDEILTEAITRETEMKKFYATAVCEVGPDACNLVSRFILQCDDRIRGLEALRTELENLRELTGAIAD